MRLVSSILAFALVAVAGCDPFRTESREFVVHIDSIRGPSTASPTAGFQVLFYGPLGPNLCYRFQSFRTTRTPASADVTVLGKSVSGTCPQAVSYLTGAPLMIEPPVTDPFLLRVNQPNGAVLSTTFRVQ